MIKGVKQEFECIAGKRTRLTRDVDYYLEINHPRKLTRNDFGARTLKHETVDRWSNLVIKEILLERNGEYCIVTYMQSLSKNKKRHVEPNPCIYVAEPIDTPFLKANIED